MRNLYVQEIPIASIAADPWKADPEKIMIMMSDFFI